MTYKISHAHATETTINWAHVGRVMGAVSGIAGAVVLVGWQFDVTLMRSVLPGLISMQPATAVCLFIVGSLLAFPRGPRGLHALVGIVAIALSLAHVAEFVFAVSPGIDQLFFPEKVFTQDVLPRHPGRMAEGTSTSLLLLSTLILVERLAPKKLAVGIYTFGLSIPLIISAISLLAYLLAVRSARGVVGYTDIALPTAVCILLLSIAALTQRAETSILRISAQAGSTGQLMRRIVLGALIVPPGLSWIALQASNLNLITTDFRLVLTTVGTMTCLLALAIVSIQRISHSEARLEEERARAESNEAQMRNIIAKAHQAIVTCDEDGRVFSWNRQAETIFGWTEKEAVGKGLTDLIIPEKFHEAHITGMKRFLSKGEATVIGQRVELPALRRDGSEFMIEMALSATRAPMGWQFTAMMHDITERLQQTSLFETAFDHAPIGVALVALDGRFMKANQAFCKIVDLTQAELAATDFQSITHPDDVESDVELLRQLTAGEIPHYQMDKRYLRTAKGIVWVSLSVSMVREESGAPKHYIAQVKDLTERMEAQLALEQRSRELVAAKAEADAAAAAKAEFMANMSHEIRTPLTVMIGFSSLLEQLDDLSEEGLLYSQRISTASNALLSLVNDILDFSKLEAGEAEVRPKPTEVMGMSQELLLLMENQAGAKGLTLHFKASAAVPAAINIDPQCYRQVLINLLGNAVKFTDTGEVKLYLDYSADQLEVRVVDSGPGMDDASAAKLFQRFFQIDGSLTRKHGGTGLGLAICRGLVEAMGGEIAVDTALGRGSTFRFRIPAPIAIDDAGQVLTEALPRLAGIRVLVVDDNAVNRELARNILERADADVVEAVDGPDAVALAKIYPVDCILMDIRMPGMDGVMAARHVREHSGPNQNIPILAFTANGNDPFDRQDFDGIVAKPTTPQGLISAIARATLNEAVFEDPQEHRTA